MELLDKIKSCETSLELDKLRREIVKAAENGEDFTVLQKAFIKKKNSLKRNGHTARLEGYSVSDLINKKLI